MGFEGIRIGEIKKKVEQLIMEGDLENNRDSILSYISATYIKK
jgi:hypothetical protein